MGHLELAGFETFKGSIASHGDSSKIYDKFDLVFSGHYHHKSTNGHIFYLGSFAEFTWSDYNDEKGFHIFDTDSLQLSFIKNPFTMFEKINYDEDNIKDINIDVYKNKYVKLIIQKKKNQYIFDKFISNLEEIGLADLQIIEEININISEDNDLIDEAESTIDIFKKYIDSNYTDNNNIKQKLENIFVELYQEAITLE